jgi:mannosyltransferase OCH1-like enzyme
MIKTSVNCFIFLSVSTVSSIDPWNLPALPSNPPPALRLGNATVDKLIPRHLWIAVRDDKEPLSYQMQPLFQRNKNWEVHVCSNDAKDLFMNTTFANTSLLWAYNSISPVAGAAKADLWRYAVLWTYGGAYIDDDSDIGAPLDKMVEPLDTLIISYEKNGFNANRCYIPRYHLSDFYAYKNESQRDRKVFHHRCLLNWAMVSAPRHAIIAATIHNAVEIIRQEYLSDSVLRSLTGAYRWEAIMCATGPSLLTATAREVILQDLPGVTYKLANVDFKDYGGKFKAVYVPVKNDPTHYMHKMTGKLGSSPNLLSNYLPEQPVSAQELKEWQGWDS